MQDVLTLLKQSAIFSSNARFIGSIDLIIMRVFYFSIWHCQVIGFVIIFLGVTHPALHTLLLTRLPFSVLRLLAMCVKRDFLLLNSFY